MAKRAKAVKTVENQEPDEIPRFRGKGFARSIRFDRFQAEFLREEERRLDITTADVVREALDDKRTFFAMPRPQLQKLLIDMENLKLTRREYMQFLLSLRYEAIIQGHVDLSAPPEVVPGRSR